MGWRDYVKEAAVGIRIEFISVRLCAHGDHVDPQGLSEVLGVSDAACGLNGESSPSGRIFDTNSLSWSVDGCDEGDYEHEMGEAVDAFAGTVLPVAPQLRELARRAEVMIGLALGCNGKAANLDGWWFLDQGFTLGTDVIQRLAEIGLPVHITEYISIPDSERAE